MKTLKLFLLITIFKIGSIAFAQLGNSPANYYTPISPFVVGIDGFYSINSNTLTNEFIYDYARGRVIRYGTKNRVIDRMWDQNNFGGDINAGAYFLVNPETLFGKAGRSWYVGIRNRDNLNGIFSGEFFQNTYGGNEKNIGEEVFLSGFEVNYLRYQQLEAGIMFNEGRSGIGLSLLKGERHFSYRLPSASIFTSADFEFIELEMSLRHSTTNPNNRGIHAVNGGGASIDFFTSFNFGTMDTMTNKILIELRDLGLIRWDNNSYNYRVDSTYNFSGFQFTDPQTLIDTVYGGVINDSVLVAHGARKTAGYTTFLPALFHIADIYKINNDLSVTVGLKYRILANYNVFLYLLGRYRVNPFVELSARIAWGGYGGFNSGFAINLDIKPLYTLTLGTETIEGWLVPAQLSGNSAFFSFRRKF
jgi:hypothetical protein